MNGPSVERCTLGVAFLSPWLLAADTRLLLLGFDGLDPQTVD